MCICLLGRTEGCGDLKAASEVQRLAKWARVVGSDTRVGHGDKVGKGVVVCGPSRRVPREDLSRDVDGNGVLGASRRGRVVVATGDTMPSEAMSHGRSRGEEDGQGQESESKGLHKYCGD